MKLRAHKPLDAQTLLDHSHFVFSAKRELPRLAAQSRYLYLRKTGFSVGTMGRMWSDKEQ